MLQSRHLYLEIYKLLQHFTEGHTRKIRLFFPRLRVGTSHNFETTARACVSVANWRQLRVQSRVRKFQQSEAHVRELPPT